MQIETVISLTSLVVCIGCYVSVRRMRVSLEKVLKGGARVETRTSAVQKADGTTKVVESKVTYLC